MTEQKLNIFQEALKHLPFCGVSIKDFARQIGIAPHTLYNYICGQRPAQKHYDYILFMLKRDYPAAIATAQEMTGGKSDGVL